MKYQYAGEAVEVIHYEIFGGLLATETLVLNCPNQTDANRRTLKLNLDVALGLPVLTKGKRYRITIEED